MFTIIHPCNENWEDMVPIEKGVYCNACCKDVIDFSEMQEQEILKYFQERKNEGICGRFRKDQLNRPLIEISPSIFSLEIPFWKKFLAALFIFFSAFITGCTNNSEKDYTTAEVPKVSNAVRNVTQTVTEDLVSKEPSSGESDRFLWGITTSLPSRPGATLPDSLFSR